LFGTLIASPEGMIGSEEVGGGGGAANSLRGARAPQTI